MALVDTNIGQNPLAPVGTKNNLVQQDLIAGGLEDQRDKLKAVQKSYIKYINIINSEESNYPIYSYMFNKSFATIKDSDIVFFDDVVVKMKEASEPLIYQYIEESENEPWMEVFPRFMEYLFFMNAIWVWYDTEEEKFYLLSKLKPEDEKDNSYMDLLTAKTVVLPTEEPIKCMWDGRDNAHFETWFKACYECISREQLMQKMWLVNGKRLKFTVEKADEIKSLEHEILTTDAYVAVVNSTALVEAMESIDPNALEIGIKNHYLMWDRNMAELGRITNINDKGGERVTTGENYKDMHGILCRQQATLSQLKLFSNKLAKIKNVQLEFKLLGAIDKTMDEMEEKEADGMQFQNKQDKKSKPI